MRFLFLVLFVSVHLMPQTLKAETTVDYWTDDLAGIEYAVASVPMKLDSVKAFCDSLSPRGKWRLPDEAYQSNANYPWRARFVHSPLSEKLFAVSKSFEPQVATKFGSCDQTTEFPDSTQWFRWCLYWTTLDSDGKKLAGGKLEAFGFNYISQETLEAYRNGCCEKDAPATMKLGAVCIRDL